MSKFKVGDMVGLVDVPGFAPGEGAGRVGEITAFGVPARALRLTVPGHTYYTVETGGQEYGCVEEGLRLIPPPSQYQAIPDVVLDIFKQGVSA